MLLPMLVWFFSRQETVSAMMGSSSRTSSYIQPAEEF